MRTKLILIFILFISACSKVNLIGIQGKNVRCEAEYAEQMLVDYFGSFNFYYSITVGKKEQTSLVCNGVACLQGHRLIITEDTPEYHCQQILHELGHLVLYELYNDIDLEHSNTDFFVNYVPYACQDVRTKNICE